MNNSITLLSLTGISLGFIHTLLGPDHYLPFIVLSEAKKWTIKRTMLITFLCGIGHVLSSVIIGFIGIAIGISINKVVAVESFRGNIAAWLFISFGLIYMILSIKDLIKGRTHAHAHLHPDGEVHLHEHNHLREHAHFHEDVVKTTPWVLFLIFVFGPCEPLIPLLMYPAAENNIAGVIIVSFLFSLSTITTMMAIVLGFKLGLAQINLKPLEKYSHLLAGTVIFISGLAIEFLGL